MTPAFPNWDGNFSVVASGSEQDQWNGVASVELFYSGTTPDTTYTARGFHKPVADLWDNDYVWPYGIYYYDDYNFTSFENQGIYEPWYYYFLSPGFQEIHRRTAPIGVGSTYDTDSVQTPKAKPDRLAVWADSGAVALQDCPAILTRSLTYQVVDNTPDRNPLHQTFKVQEVFSNQTTNTCGNGLPPPKPCVSTSTAGQIQDTLSITCGGASGAQSNPSCGFSQTQKISTCGASNKIELSSVIQIVKANELLVNDVAKFDPLGTMLPK